ncbi:MAG: DUF559 domain-containing protein [Pseudomonadota bacterium]
MGVIDARHSLLGKSMTSTFARHLRQNLTDAENAFWRRLRRKQLDGFKFRRQAPIGRYVVDFVCLEKRLIIELDGGQHAIREDADARRAAWLRGEGFHIVRFWNNEVLEDMDRIVESIRRTLNGI